MTVDEADLKQKLLEIRNNTEQQNHLCADCGTPGNHILIILEPEWTCFNLGIFICVHCCGIHRHLGTHISRVKSIKLDTWTPELIQYMQEKGNLKHNSVYLKYLPVAYKRLSGSDLGWWREEWIRWKYVLKRFHQQSEGAMVPVKAGFLKKKGKTQSKWPSRFFTLTSKHLLYYKNADQIDEPLGQFSLEDIKVEIADQVTHQHFSLHIFSQNRSIFVTAANSGECFEWLNCIRAAKHQLLSLKEYKFIFDNLEYEKLLNAGWLRESKVTFCPSEINSSKFSLFSSNNKKQYCFLRLDYEYLRYYLTPMDPFPQFSIPVSLLTLQDEDFKSKEDDYGFALRVFNSDIEGLAAYGKDLKFICDNSVEKEFWMQAFQQVFYK